MDDSLRFIAHYPFTTQAKAYAKRYTIVFDDATIQKGKERLRRILMNDSSRTHQSEADPLDAIISFAAAKAILSSDGARMMPLIRRFAVVESKDARAHFERESAEHPHVLTELAAGIGLSLTLTPSGGVLSLPEYLMNMPPAPEYSLLNLTLKEGKVILSRKALLRVLEEAIRKKIERELPLSIAPTDALKRAAQEIFEVYAQKTPVTVRKVQGELAPCIESLCEKARDGINLSHRERVFLAMYLNSRGWSTKDIVDVFRQQPDFNEKTTTYHVEYVKRKNYTPPTCATLRVHGMCVASCGVSSPLHFERKPPKKETHEKETEKRA